ncbi:hypothetical protein PTKIN_Ptkin09bG0284000 [Pterospermum kingtungense]
MGKNQAYKAMQRARLGFTFAGPEGIDDGMNFLGSSNVLVVFRVVFVFRSFSDEDNLRVACCSCLASPKTSCTVTWEELKRKQKEDVLKKGEVEADTDRMMREYRAQLDAERAQKLVRGRNHSSSKSGHKKDRKDKDSKKCSNKKRKLLNLDLCSVQDGGLLSLAPPVHPPNLLVMKKRENRGGDPSLREARKRSSNQKNKNSSSDIEEAEGPVPLSRFFECVKS